MLYTLKITGLRGINRDVNQAALCQQKSPVGVGETYGAEGEKKTKVRISRTHGRLACFQDGENLSIAPKIPRLPRAGAADRQGNGTDMGTGRKIAYENGPENTGVAYCCP